MPTQHYNFDIVPVREQGTLYTYRDIVSEAIEIFMLCQVGYQDNGIEGGTNYALISLREGNRYCEPMPLSDILEDIKERGFKPFFGSVTLTLNPT